jgi:hypothetical protein
MTTRAMPMLRVLRRAPALLVRAGALLFVALAAALFILPGLAERELSRRVRALPGLDGSVTEVRRAGLFGADLGNISLGGPPAFFECGAVSLDYTPWGLLRGRLSRARIAGARLRLRHDESGFSLAGAPPALFSQKNGKEKEKSPLVIPLDSLEVSGLVLAKGAGRPEVSLPFLASLVLSKDTGRADLSLQLHPPSGEARVTGSLDLHGGASEAVLRAPEISLAALAALFPETGLACAGTMDLRANTRFFLSPFSLAGFEAEAALAHATARAGAAVLSSATGTLAVRLVQGGGWRAQGRGIALAAPVSADFDSLEITLAPNGIFAATSQEVSLAFQGGAARAERISLTGTARTAGSGKGNTVLVVAGAEARKLTLAAGGIVAQARQISLEGALETMASGPAVLTGVFAVGDGGFSHTSARVEVSGISGGFPLVWPLRDTGATGALTAQSVAVKGMPLGSAKISIRPVEKGGNFSGAFVSTAFPGFALNAKGAWRAEGKNGPELDATIQAPAYNPPGGFPLAQFKALPQGLSAGGTVTAEGGFRLSRAGFSGSAALGIDNGWLDYPASGAFVRDVKGHVRFPALPAPASAPGQTLAFQSAGIGKFAFGKGEIRFHLESGEALFIEEARAEYSGGTLRLDAARIAKGEGGFKSALFCDRLRLAGVLAQTGGMEAEGDGTVSGRVPFEAGKNGLRFGRAFLYSAPGEGGKLRVTGAKALAEALPEGAAQRAQVDFARAALEDYDYDWAKITLEMKGNDLAASLTMNGKPANVLPFMPSQEHGGFVRVRTGEAGARFQGVRFDLNFTLPLDEALRYGKGARGVMNLGK